MDTFPYHQPFIPPPSLAATTPHPSAGGPQEEDRAHTPRDDRRRNRRKGAGVKLSTDPQSVAARERRHRISDRFKILQSLVPGGSKMDTVSMLEEAIHYVKFLKAQIWLHQALMANREESSPTPPPPTLAPLPPPSFASFPSNTSLDDGYDAIAAGSPLGLPPFDQHQQSLDNDYSLPPLPGQQLWSFQPENEMLYSSQQLPPPIDYYQC